eukprot:gene14227-biopygen4020
MQGMVPQGGGYAYARKGTTGYAYARNGITWYKKALLGRARPLRATRLSVSRAGLVAAARQGVGVHEVVMGTHGKLAAGRANLGRPTGQRHVSDGIGGMPRRLGLTGATQLVEESSRFCSCDRIGGPGQGHGGGGSGGIVQLRQDRGSRAGAWRRRNRRDRAAATGSGVPGRGMAAAESAGSCSCDRIGGPGQGHGGGG